MHHTPYLTFHSCSANMIDTVIISISQMKKTKPEMSWPRSFIQHLFNMYYVVRSTVTRINDTKPKAHAFLEMMFYEGKQTNKNYSMQAEDTAPW